jgi:hypothetical protein
MKGKMELNGFGGFTVNLSNHTRLTTQSHDFECDGLDSKSPIEAPRWRNVCGATNLSHRNLGFENRGKRKRLTQRRSPKPLRELPKHPQFLVVGFKILIIAFYCL